MKQDIKGRWIEALRSGQYRQGTDNLRVPDKILGDSYCCLGVLCELASREDVVFYDAEENMYVSTSDTEDRSDQVLPKAVLDWAGLPFQGVTGFNEVPLPNAHEGAYLTTLNDQLGYSFQRIADVIEEKL